MTDKNEKTGNGHDATNVPRLSPRELFEDLLGDPSERGYDEETLEKIYTRSRDFACDRRYSWQEAGGEEKGPVGKNDEGEKPGEK